MNLPNKISMSRLIFALALITVFALHIMDVVEGAIAWPTILGLFAIGSFTDFLDGKIARSRNLVTTFGKFIDPISDKILVNATMILISGYYVANGGNYILLFVTTAMIVRDIAVDASRMMCAAQGKVVAASIWGKLKTILQMVFMTTLLIGFAMKANSVDIKIGTELLCCKVIEFSIFGLVAAAVASWFGGIDYIKNAKEVIFKTK